MKKTTKRQEAAKAAKKTLTAADVVHVTGGLISEVGFPACDAGSKDGAKLVS